VIAPYRDNRTDRDPSGIPAVPSSLAN